MTTIALILVVFFFVFFMFFFVKQNKDKKKKKNILSSLMKKEKNLIDFRNRLDSMHSLMDMINIHKDIYREFKFPALEVSPWGHFRASSVEELDANNVYLGGIYGLFTNTVAYWELNKNSKYGVNNFGVNPEVFNYTLIRDQYYMIMSNAINAELVAIKIMRIENKKR